MLSGTGFKTTLVGENPILSPVELRRGGMALGEGKLSDAIIVLKFGRRDSVVKGRSLIISLGK